MRVWLALLLWVGGGMAFGAEPSQPDSNPSYRTDSANERLPWYQLKPGEFPPRGSEHRISGELLEADFIHRTGQFRNSATGELVDFTLLPYGVIKYLNAEADLRDLPLGARFEFSLYQDQHGAFTQAALMADEFTQLAGAGITYRLDKTSVAGAGQGQLEVVRQSVPRNELNLGNEQWLVDSRTRIWKGDKQIPLADMAVGDALLVNFTGGQEKPRPCSDIWIGAETQKLATERQRTAHKDFLKARGLPAWIDRVDGKKLTVSLFGDPAGLAALFKDEGIDPQVWAKEHRFVRTVVANAELRSYNPPVDGENSMVVDFQSVPTDRYGLSGVRWGIEPALLLEGFRKGRVVRLFASPAWPVKDMPFGESLYSEAPGVSVGMEEAAHYPYRTDFANERLPWYQLKPVTFPPFGSQHQVEGELVSVDAVHRSGQFRADRTGELVNFTMPPYGSIQYLSSAADLRDLPLKTRYHFYLYQDAAGAFTKAVLIMDDFSRLVNDKRSYRVEQTVEDGELVLASQQGLIKNEKDELYRPPDVGRGQFLVDGQTRVWKNGDRVTPGDLATGDELLVNLTGRSAEKRSNCAEIWIGAKTHELTTTQQRAKYHASTLVHGFPGWVESIAGKEITVVFFVGAGDEFQTLFHDGPVGGKLRMSRANNDLLSDDSTAETMSFKSSVLSGIHPGTYGCRGTRWVIESERSPTTYQPGQVVRVFDPAWSTK